ncbi:MBL fold metallo-hydrolase [Tersicoccus sp. MR15.9]|uniref:MBL fold metallo-hydrolase n=1 Tax=Tersicoccus mangrovi TaxID=3121635 RepID=UPI002FE62F22
MEAVSAQQHHAATEGGLPETEQIAAGLWSVPMPMPGGFLAYSLSVVHVGDDGAVTVLDPGWAADGSFDRFADVLHSLGSRVQDVATVVVTHAHPDHIGLADPIREASGARIHVSAREQESIDAQDPDLSEGLAERLGEWHVPGDVAETLLARLAQEPARPAPPRADDLLEDGDEVPVGGGTWRVLATPGHTPGHLCLVDDTRRLLFSGDHVLPTLSPGLGLGAPTDTNPVVDYLRALDRLAPWDDYQVVPGHGYRFRGLAERRAELAEHVLARAREVAHVIDGDPGATTWQVASRLTWTAGWDQLVGSVRLRSALLQTELYRDAVLTGDLHL